MEPVSKVGKLAVGADSSGHTWATEGLGGIVSDDAAREVKHGEIIVVLDFPAHEDASETIHPGV